MSAPASITAIIVAAGSGSRVGGIPKQWRELAGIRVVDRAIVAFAGHPRVGRVLVVVPASDANALIEGDGGDIVIGGETRQDSVRNALEHLAETNTASVLIHDAARPLVSHEIIDRVLAGLDTAPAAAPALSVTDALWRGDAGQVSGVADRSGLFRAQTPQGFHFEPILAAHRTAKPGAADDVEIARAAGIEVAIVEGDEANLKITHELDFSRAEKMLGHDMDVRTGNGFDVHRFGGGDHVTLCGVQIPHERGLTGHSDADVAMHALTDAIYGALAEGDIGQHFPPSDPHWKGADSTVFLLHAVQLAADRDFKISNLDVTLICEFPKIGPRAEGMRARLSDITGLPANRISVKATTTEQLGFTGRSEGIAASATATLIKT